MSAGTRLVLSGFVAAAATATATLTALSEGIASADDSPGSPPGVVTDALAGPVPHGEFAGAQSGLAGPSVVIATPPEPTPLPAALVEQPSPGGRLLRPLRPILRRIVVRSPTPPRDRSPLLRQMLPHRPHRFPIRSRRLCTHPMTQQTPHRCPVPPRS